MLEGCCKHLETCSAVCVPHLPVCAGVQAGFGDFDATPERGDVETDRGKVAGCHRSVPVDGRCPGVGLAGPAGSCLTGRRDWGAREPFRRTMGFEMRQGAGENRIPWKAVETVLLDMDGTLLDLHFDDYFWLEHVPRRYGELHGLAPEQARERLLQTYRRYEGTLEWYSVDFWSDRLGLDVAALKEEVRHLVAERPEVRSFLQALREQGKRTVLVTNAHGKSLALKMRETRLDEELDRVVCAHDLGLPKEEPEFWRRLREIEPFDPQSTLLIDDSLPVLRSAQTFGIRYLLAVERPNLRAPSRHVTEFPAVASFGDLAAELRRSDAPASAGRQQP